ncbi:MAG: hypothetical protein ACRD26_15385 [Vicinamibacterales bacterium]
MGIAEIAVLTCDRPARLARVLDGYATVVDHRAPPEQLTVFDDSSCPEIRAENARVLREIERHRGTPIWYVGPIERQRFVRRLEQAGFPPDVLEFGLLGRSWNERTVGCNRNAVLLESAGRLLLSVDDDTDAAVRPSPALKPGLRLATLAERATDPVFPCDLWTYDTHDAVRNDGSWRADGVLAVHERLLGRTAQACVAEFAARNEPVRVDAVAPAAFAARLAPRRIVVTLSGLAGDCGWRSPAPYLWLRDRSLGQLTRSAEHYRAACGTRTVLRVAESYAVVDRSMNMMGTFFGLDNTQIAPPFPPIGRGQDVVFGVLAGACVPDACFGHVPWAMPHEPVESRQFRARDVVSAALGTDLCVVTTAVVLALSADLPVDDAGASMQMLGRRLAALGSDSFEHADACIRSAVMRLVGEQFAALERQLHGGQTAAPFWAADARHALELWKRAGRHAGYHVPVECLKNTDLRGGMERTVAYLRQFGRLLEQWPGIVRASIALRESGGGLAIPTRSNALRGKDGIA